MKDSPHIKLAHKYWEELLSPEDSVIDATCGNGHDLLFLSSLIKKGNIYAYDIQEKALASASSLLKQNLSSFDNISLIHASHEKFQQRENIKLIVYNLGYLPGGDKSLTTKTDTTLKSITNALDLILNGGAISITTYSGHLEGEKEEEALFNLASSLDSKKFCVCQHRWLNKKKAPALLWIRKY